MDREQMAAVYDKHKDTVYRIAMTYCKCPEDAEDVMQDVFLKHFSSDRTFPTDEAEKAWLIRLTINRSLNLIKSFHRSRRAPLEEWNAVCRSPGESDVLAAVNSLPAKYRILIYLYYFEGYSVKEISALTHVSVTSVQTRLHRARARLKTILKEDFDL